MKLKKKIYLANPYGFCAQAKEKLLPEIVERLAALDLEVWEPFARNNQADLIGKPGWAYTVARCDYRDVVACDAIFAVINGTPPDEGVMIELGVAIALHKPTFLFRDDFRRCTDSEDYPLNLMLFAGLPENTWRDFYYTKVSEITSPEKALAVWAGGGKDIYTGLKPVNGIVSDLLALVRWHSSLWPSPESSLGPNHPYVVQDNKREQLLDDIRVLANKWEIQK